VKTVCDWMMPAPQIDTDRLPPPIMTSEPGSFAQRTFQVRIPAIVDEILRWNEYPDDIVDSLVALRDEILSRRWRELREATPDGAFWTAAMRPYVGRTWLDLPWYLAETFFYRRVLEATRYFQPGPWHGFDPYGTTKASEWQPEAAPRQLAAALSGLPRERQVRFLALLHHSLWGNRTDLSYNVALSAGRVTQLEAERDYLLVDDTALVWDFLVSRPGRQVVVICDNAGTELLMDLALVDFLLSERLAGEVVLHLKPQPLFVSDAMPADVQAGLASLEHAGEPGRALRARLMHFREAGRLRLFSHWVYASSLCYFQLPADLRQNLAAADLVLLKGDVNYRRTVGDVHWPPTTPYADVTAYFPAPRVNLRTLKGELITGLAPGQPEALSAQDPEWLVNGRRGVIQAALAPQRAASSDG
jgi:hypothetical protein